MFNQTIRSVVNNKIRQYHWLRNTTFVALNIFAFSFIIVSAQETTISQHTEVYGLAGDMSSTMDVPTSGVHSISITAGQPFIGKSTSSNYSTDLGIWAFYLKEPDKPLVDASDGDAAHPKSIKISWNLDILSPQATGEIPAGSSFPEDRWKVTRDGDFRANVAMDNPSFSDDQSIFPGQLYNYGVKVANKFGVSVEGFDNGFTMANGKIAGRVFTPGPTPGAPWTPTGNPVADVEVSLSPIRGKSLRYDGNDDYAKVDASYNDSISAAFTVELWVNIDQTPGDAILFDMGDRFRFGHSSSQLEAIIGTNSVSTSLPNVESWRHVACVYDNGVLKLFLDGDSIGFTDISTLPSGQDIRIGKHRSNIKYFDGYLDDIRVWNIARTQDQIQRNMSRALFGDEPGLLGYWKFDEGTGDVSFDMTDEKESATIFGAAWSTDIPAIKLSDYTDTNGKYEIRGIWYDATNDDGTMYTVTPYKENHEFFTPSSEDATLDRNNPQADDVKFLDESMFTVSGYLTYDGTNCPVINAEILVDSVSNRPETFTDDEGKFTMDFEPDESGILTVRFGGYFDYDTLESGKVNTLYVNGHIFELDGVEQGYHVENIEEDVAGVHFVDMHKESLSGIIGGGICLFPIGDVKITLRTTPSCSEVIDTVATGEDFTINNLAPLDYQVIIESDNPDITFQNDVISLRDSSLSGLTYVYRAPLEVEFTDLPGNECEIANRNIVHQFETDSVYIKVFESYGSNECYLDEIHCVINDELTNMSYEGNGVLDENGEIPIFFTPREPNILSGGEHPYQKKLEVTVTDASGRKKTNSFWAIITGEKKSEDNQFTTSTSKMPWFVLRNPPGDGSYTYFSNEQQVCENFSLYKTDADGNQTTETLHLGFDKTVVAGFGVAIETKWSVELEAGHGWTGTKTDVDIDETSFCFTRSETYSTSGDELVTGDDASVFVGGGLSMTFGIATLISVDDNCDVQLDTTLVAGVDGFNSTYMFSKYYIKNDLMPNLYMQWTVENDSSALNNWNYWKEILRQDSTAVATAVNHDAFQFGTGETASNISFDAGVSFEYSTSTDSSFSSGTQVVVENSNEVFGSGGFTIDAFGFSVAYAHNFYNAEDETNTNDTTRTKTIGFVLDDNDPGDAFTVDVLRDTIWGMPVFKTLGGQSSNPWEQGTLKRQWADLSLDPIVQADVEPDEAAVFTLYLGNQSETGETWAYNLSLLNETNPYGAIVQVNGVNLGASGIDFEIDAGTSINATMTVGKGPDEYDYEDLMLNFAPPGEIEIADALGEDPQNSEFAIFTTYFIKPCSEVAIASPDKNWIINQFSGDSLKVTLNEFDTTDTELQRLALEYSKSSENQWFVADTISMDSVSILGQNYAAINWKVNGIDDGDYIIRGKAVCRLREGASKQISGIIDRRSPEILGVPEPADEILQAYDQISISLDENINTDKIYPSTGELYFAQTGEPIACELACSDNTLIITPATSVANREIENKRLKAEVHFLQDVAGNPMQVDTLAWEFVVDRNPIHWNVSNHEQVAYIGEETVIPIELNNNGGSMGTFEFGNLIDLPEWITPTPFYGNINPGGSMTIYLYVDPYLNIGDYIGTIYAETPEGDEPLELTIHAMCKPPEWDIYIPGYQYSMSITAALSVQGNLSGDEYDRVGAFVGDECRGFAELEHVVVVNDTGEVILDTYLAFLNVYSNKSSDEDITFRIWDNSRCHELWEIEQAIPFVNNGVVGSPSMPYVLNATGAIAQEFSFEAGWTWFSLNLDYGDMSFDHVLNGLNATSGDRIIASDAYAQFSEEASDWVGPLAETNSTNTKMYQADMKTADEFPFIGYVVDPEEIPIYLVPGWNWIGYTPQVNLKLNEAIATLSPSQDDVIKSQFSYAQYDAIFGWLGNLNWMQPGWGYMAKVAEADTLIYPYGITKGLSIPLLAKSTATNTDTLPEPGWSVNPHKYPFNMTITALLESDTIGMNDPADVLVAIFDGEVRGVSRPVYIPELDAYRVFMMVYGRENESISFIIYDTDKDITYRSNESMKFTMDEIHGTLRKPIYFTKAPLKLGDKGYIPEVYSLSRNFPNPFNPTTKFGFGLPDDSDVRIRIYNILGQEVKTLVSDHFPAGYRFVLWNGTDNYGRNVTSGVYIAVMESGNFRQVRKMVLMK